MLIMSSLWAIQIPSTFVTTGFTCSASQMLNTCQFGTCMSLAECSASVHRHMCAVWGGRPLDSRVAAVHSYIIGPQPTFQSLSSQSTFQPSFPPKAECVRATDVSGQTTEANMAFPTMLWNSGISGSTVTWSSTFAQLTYAVQSSP